MSNISELLIEFEKRLCSPGITVSQFVAELGEAPNEECLLELIGIAGEHNLRFGKYDSNTRLRTEFPETSEDKVVAVLDKAVENFVATYCPVTDVLGPLPTELDQYQISREIGRGGSGVVYRGTQKGLQRDVAIKVPFAINENGTCEGAALAKVKHNNIASVFGFGKMGRFSYIAMQLVNGECLKQYCRNPPRLSVRSIVSWMIELLDAIGECHSRGIVHGDLKPANIIVMDDRPVIVDFGLATTIASPNGYLHGTPGYMAPELYDDRIVASPISSDLFSLGVILYELLTGSRPYPGDAKFLPARRCEDLRPEIDQELSSICSKAISIRPEDRFQNAITFRDALVGWKTNLEQDASPNLISSPVQVTIDQDQTPSDSRAKSKIGPFQTRSKWLATASALALLLAAIWFASGTFFGSNSVSNVPEIVVELFRQQVGDDILLPMGKIGVPDVRPHENDFAQVIVQLERPQYINLVAANPDGQLQFLATSDGKVSSLVFPEEEDAFFKFSDGPGQQAFIVILTNQPIKQWNRWVNTPPDEVKWNGGTAMNGTWRVHEKKMTEIGASDIERGNVVKKDQATTVLSVLEWFESECQAPVHALLFPIKK